MTAERPTFAVGIRVCPHCSTTILKSATVCPACHRHLHFDALRTDQPTAPAFCPLHVEGTIRHPGNEAPWEYFLVLQVQDDEGKIISRHVASVGVLSPAEARTFTVRVEISVPQKSAV